MARLILNQRTGPFVLSIKDLPGDKLFVCGCGLSSTPPFCDGSHARARKEPADVLLHYPGNDDEAAAFEVEGQPFGFPAKKPAPKEETA